MYVYSVYIHIYNIKRKRLFYIALNNLLKIGSLTFRFQNKVNFSK